MVETKWWWPVVVAALVASGAAVAQAESPGLEGTAWNLAAVGGQAAEGATLRFAGGRVSGSDGCNRFSGSYTMEGERLRLGRLASTQMACPEETMARARAFTEALAATKAARIEGDRLELLDAAGSPLAAFAVQSATLTGTSWQVTGYNNGRSALVSALSGSEVVLRFGDDGEIGGSTGCNRFSGSYQQTGRALALGELALTRMSCAVPTGVMEQEKAFLDALRSARTIDLEAERLELRTADGALALTARRN